MVDEITSTLINYVVGALAGGMLTWITAKYRQVKQENSALKLGVQALLRDRIIQAYNHYVTEKGWIPIYAKESIDACYSSYEDLGNNGVIDDLMRQINQLPNYEVKHHE
ncbi:hypothetical protein [Phascolarctobacterium sp.]|uniref:hypothetical protein n=1 Tax=Phascolarctobacterium sp. TaxID=2049039 RepID=UPI00386B7D87